MDYEAKIKKYLKEVKDQEVRARIHDLYNYLVKIFPGELAIAQRDYELGLSDTDYRKDILTKAYRKENELRRILGINPLPAIDLSVI